MNKDQLVALRNLALDLHLQAGQTITIPTDGAIAGSADQTTIRNEMTPLLTQMLTDISEILTGINAPSTIVAGRAAFTVGPHLLAKQ